MRISDWSSDVCSSDLPRRGPAAEADGHGFFARSPGADRSDSQRFAIFIGQAKPNAVALGPDANRETHRRILDRDFLLLVRRLPHDGGPGGRPFTLRRGFDDQQKGAGRDPRLPRAEYYAHTVFRA